MYSLFDELTEVGEPTTTPERATARTRFLVLIGGLAVTTLLLIALVIWS